MFCFMNLYDPKVQASAGLWKQNAYKLASIRVHVYPVDCRVYGKPVELDAYDRDQEGKYIRDNIEGKFIGIDGVRRKMNCLCTI